MIKVWIKKEGKEVEIEVRRMGLGVLRALERWGVLGLSQLDGLLFQKDLREEERLEKFFNSSFRGEYRGASYKVLGRLEGWGLVAVHHYVNVPRVYTLTGKGHGVLVKEGLAKLTAYRDSVADSLVKHELLVNGVGLAMSELLGLKVSTDFERHVLSRGSQKTSSSEEFPLPDLWVTDRTQPKAVEVERTQKSARRYEKLWDFYRNSLPGNTVVLYVAAFPNGQRLLLSRARKLMADFIYVCGIDDFRASLGSCPFIGYRGGQVLLSGRPARPEGPRPQRVAAASISARPVFAGPGELLPAAPSAPPPRFIRIGELLRPRSRSEQSASPLGVRPFPRPLPPAPSPTPEGGTDRS